MLYFVTGGAGFVGSHLIDLLTSRGDHVVVLDDLSTGRLENIEHLLSSDLVEFVEGSVLDEALVDDCMGRADKAFHLASAVGVQLIVERPLDSLLTNVRGCDVVMGAAARHEVPLLFTSTSEVYGKNSQGALDEDADRLVGSPFKARWGYSTAKSFGEALVHSYVRELDCHMVAARLFNTVGPRQTGAYGMVLPRLVRQALDGDELTVFGNGTQSRCFTHVLDTVQALVLLSDASEEARGRVFNIGSTVEVAIIELAGRVIERTNSRSAIRLVPYHEAYEDGFEELGRRKPNLGAIESLTGWKPMRSVETAIDDLIAWHDSEPSTDPRMPVGVGASGSALDVNGRAG